MVGVKTNVVTSVEVTPAAISDYQIFPALVNATAARFNVQCISADKAYSGRSNLAVAESIGALPLIPFRSNAKTDQLETIWKRMYDYFHENRDDFYQLYHRRSNVKAAFHMIKSKFGAFVRSKLPTAQVNEVLCKVVRHNLCCLVNACYESGIEPEFWQNGTSALYEARPPAWFRNIPPRTPLRRVPKASTG